MAVLLANAATQAGWAQPVREVEQDVVYRRSGITVRGKIISYDASGLRVEVRSGSNHKVLPIPAKDVERVEIRLTQAQQEAEELYDQGQYRGAAVKFEVALEAEQRAWLRRRIQSKLVTCHLAVGDSVEAVDAFLHATGSGEGTVPWSAVPLWWLPESPARPVRQRAAALLDSNSAWAQIVGASYLLGTEQDRIAQQTLSQLTNHSNERMAQLARIQLWRPALARAPAGAVAKWEEEIRKLPRQLRGGPYFILGLALRRLGSYDDAALALLWPALVYPADRRLSLQATLLAAECLERSRQTAEARGLYRELTVRFAGTTEAAEAAVRLRGLEE